MKRFVSEQVADTVAVGRAVGRVVRVGDVIALDGELGAGKTQFVRGLTAGMGLDPAQVSSPTFVFVQEYVGDADDAGVPGKLPEVPGFPGVLVHVDAYRLEGPGQLASIGWGEDLLRDAVVVVEWAARIEGALGEDRLSVAISHLGEGRREIEMVGKGAWAARLEGVAVG